MRLYIVMWRAEYSPDWACGPDDIFTDPVLAEMQRHLDQHKHPKWEIIVAETEVPGVAVQPEPEAAR